MPLYYICPYPNLIKKRFLKNKLHFCIEVKFIKASAKKFQHQTDSQEKKKTILPNNTINTIDSFSIYNENKYNRNSTSHSC